MRMSLANPPEKQRTIVDSMKHTAVKVDLSRLIKRKPFQAIVISGRTTGLDIKRMVVQKVGMDQRQVPLMELVLNGWNDSDESSLNLQRRVVTDLECPLTTYDPQDDQPPKFELVWRDDVDFFNNLLIDQTKIIRTGKLENPIHHPAVNGDGLLGFRNGSTLPGHGTKEHRYLDNRLKSDCSNPGFPIIGDECLIHYEPFVPSTDPEEMSTTNCSVQMSNVSSTSKSNEVSKRTVRDSHISDRHQLETVFSDKIPLQNDTSAFRTFLPINSHRHLSVESLNVNIPNRRETKFSSLPNMEQLEDSAKKDPLSGNQTASTSLPCISAVRHPSTGKLVRRFLPEVSIPEEVVEEKRNYLSKQIQRRLSIASEKRKQHQQPQPEVARRTRVRVKHHRKYSDRSFRDELSGNDSDSVSVTSHEVAEILAEAKPMAPADSDYEEPARLESSDEDDVRNNSSMFKAIQLGSSDSESDDDTAAGSSSAKESAESSRSDHTSKLKQGTSISPARQNGELGMGKSQLHSPSKHLQYHPHKSSHHNHRLQQPHPHMLHQPPAATTSDSQQATNLQPQVSSTKKQLTLFKLLRNGLFQLFTVLVETSSTSLQLLPFEVFNGVVNVDDISRHGNLKRNVFKEKYTVLVVGDIASDLRPVEGTVEAGDILIEVNGSQVLNQSAAELTKLLSANNSRKKKSIQMVVAREIKYLTHDPTNASRLQY